MSAGHHTNVDEASFAAVVRENSVRAHALARRLVPDREADDVVQESLFRFWRAWDEEHTPEHRANLLLAIVRSVASNTRRHFRARPVTLAGDLPPDVGCTPPASHSIERAEMWARVVDAVETMPPRYRDAARAYLFGGPSPEVLAGEAGVRVGTVYVRRHRAMQHLRAVLEDLRAPAVAALHHVAQRVSNAADPLTKAATIVVIAASMTFAPHGPRPHGRSEPKEPKFSHPPVAITAVDAPYKAVVGQVVPMRLTTVVHRLTPVHVCVGSRCAGRMTMVGDEICVTYVANHRYACTTQGAIALCDLSQAPVTSCERHGSPNWLVAPSASSERRPVVLEPHNPAAP